MDKYGNDASSGNATRALIALCLLLYLPFLYTNGYRLLHAAAVDFPSFYYAAVRVFNEHASPYGPDAIRVAAVGLGQKVFPYLYPPPSLFAFYPFTHWSYETAKRLMLVINHGAFLLFAYLFLARILRAELRNGAAIAFAIGYVLLYAPLTETFANGQINIIVIALIAMSWAAMHTGRRDPWLALPLAAAVVLKTYPVLLLPILWFAGRRRAALLALIALTLITLVSVVALPAVVWREWLTQVLPTGGYGHTPWGLFSPAVMHNQSLNGFLTRLFAANPFTPTVLDHPTWIAPIAYACAAGILGLTYLAIARIMRAVHRRAAIDVAWSLGLLAMFLVSPVSWLHHAVFILPAALVALTRLGQDHHPAAAVLVLLGTLVLAWDVPIDYPALHAHPTLDVLLISTKFYAALGLWAAALAALLRLTRVTRALPVGPAPASIPIDG